MKKKKGMFLRRFAEKLDQPKSAVGLILLTAVILNIVVELLSRKSLPSLMKYLFLSPHIFLFNTLIIGATLSVIFVFRKRVFGYFVISFLWLVIGVTDFVLLLSRTTPFTAQDLRLIQYALRMIDNYIPIPVLILLILGLILVLLGLIWLWYAAATSARKFNRFFMLCLSLSSFFVVVLLTNVGNATGIIPSRFSNIANAYHTYGLPYCFSTTLLNTGIDRPSDYSDTRIDEILGGLEETVKPTFLAQTSGEIVSVETTREQDSHAADAPTKEEPSKEAAEDMTKEPEETMPETAAERSNVIVIQLESFFDVVTMNNVNFDRDPMPFFHSLMEKYPSGYVMVPSIGAGTANTEFEVLTAMNMDSFGPGEYPYKTILNRKTCESIPYIMKKNGYATHAIHNNDGTFYERHNVFANLGFDTFTSIEYMYDLTYTETGWAEDIQLIPYIQMALNSTEERDFIYAISVQGHGAYPEERVQAFPEIHYYSDNAAIKEKYNEFLYYVNQIYEMDQMIEQLVGYLSEYEEPVTLVLFGDHLPGFDFQEEDIAEHTLFETPYVIWSNHALEGEDRNLEAFQLLPHMLDMEKIRDGFLCRLHQKYLKEKEMDEDTQRKYYSDLETLEFDMLYGDQIVFGGNNPYEPTELKMGLVPITVTNVICRREVMFVLGEHFNQYSMIYVDGKPKDTIFVNENSLLTIDFSPNERQLVSVGQVGVDRVALSFSNQIDYEYSETGEVEIVHPTQVDE